MAFVRKATPLTRQQSKLISKALYVAEHSERTVTSEKVWKKNIKKESDDKESLLSSSSLSFYK